MAWSVYERQPEESFFRRAPEGWILTTPGLWPVGGGWTYRVDDAQKTELLARLARWRFISFIMFAAILAALLAVSGGLSRSGFPGWIHFAVFAGISVVSAFVLFGVAIPSFQLFILRPVLATAEPTTPMPMRRTDSWCDLLALPGLLARTYSLRWLTVPCLLSGWFSMKSGHDALTSEGGYFSAISMLLLTGVLGVALFLKLKESRSREQRSKVNGSSPQRSFGPWA
jgi:hypothetical protein